MAEPDYIKDLVATVFENLESQHDWTSLQLHTHSPTGKAAHPRPLISGLPPKRLYLHPDDQIEMIKNNTMGTLAQVPEIEFVLPTTLNETITIGFLSEIFDSMETPKDLAPGRAKRLLLAVVHDDSTVVYYFVHDGIVKPRQN
ncbi:tRNA-splicing endonuclease subunit Sen15 [Xylariales sp. PMI_506]|nr:tRNA-splicing endonuclease subunit Sen15 [Xylariales sp. PMI_506]